ncbi:MAG: hypothetical protein ACI8QZ_002897 [Chlamydiales bacterium]|jgi:hypothetical protein
MADEKNQPDEQDPLENEAGSLANQPNPLPTNRPADNARVTGPSEVEGFGWAPSDEATDFLGLNDLAKGAPGAVPGAVDPYAMPGDAQAPDTSRTTWLLNEAAQQGQVPGGAPAGDPTGQGQAPQWITPGQQPMGQPVAPQPGQPVPGSIQAPMPGADPAAGAADPNWLMSLDEQAVGAPFAPGSPEQPADAAQSPLQASFVDPEPASSAVGRKVMRSLIAVGVVAGGAVLWQVLSHHGELDQPITQPLEMERTALQNPPLEQPVESVPRDGLRPTGGAGAPERIAVSPDPSAQQVGGERRWFSNLAPRTNGDAGAAASEPSELDGDSYPWAAPTEQEASEARSVLLAFDALMGDRPLVQTGPESLFEAPPGFDALEVVMPEDASQAAVAGPPLLGQPGASAEALPVPRWLALGQRLVSADRSVLDQYNEWRLSAKASTPGVTYVPRAGHYASIEPTLEIPFFVATIGGWETLAGATGPMPASDFEPLDQAGQPQPGVPGELVAAEAPLDTVVFNGDDEDTSDLDPRRIEQDPLFTLQARLPGQGAARRTLDKHWAGVNIPMHALDYPERILTPRIGAVRILHINGEGFEGHLFAMGKGTVWLNTGIGRMAFRGDSLERIEHIDADRLAALDVGGTPTAGLEEIRVRTAGGIFVGFQLDREGDRVTMVTEDGYKITLQSDDVQPAHAHQARVGIKRRGR